MNQFKKGKKTTSRKESEETYMENAKKKNGNVERICGNRNHR